MRQRLRGACAAAGFHVDQNLKSGNASVWAARASIDSSSAAPE
jgi:hypothetical protein